MQRHTETKKRWLRLFKKHGSDQWQCLISCEWAQTLRSKYISLSVCLCDPHVLTASDSELECSCSSHGGRCWVAMRGKRAESEEFSQTERGMTNAQTHREREGGREGRSRSCWSSLLLLPPLPAGFVQAVCTLQCSASLGGAPSLCSSTQLYCLGGWVCRVQGAFPGSVLPAYGALHLGSNA